MNKPNIQLWAIERLVPYELNVKKHEPKQVAVIAKSIQEFGWTQPISVDQDGNIIAGHGRRLAALSLGYTQVPVWVRDDLTPEQVRALRLIDNKAAEGGIDTEMFRLELESLEFDMSGFYTAKELDFAIADLGAMDDGAFIVDINAAVDKQNDETKEKAAAIALKPVPIAKVFGFKDIAGSDQLVMSRFIALIEHKTGLKGAAALAAHAGEVVRG